MSFKSSLPWHLEQAMTAFQVNQNWYEEYWLRDTSDLTRPQVHRRPDGSIDIDLYCGCAKRERDLTIKKACFALLAMLVRLFRLKSGRLTSFVKQRLSRTNDKCPLCVISGHFAAMSAYARGHRFRGKLAMSVPPKVLEACGG